MKFRYKKISPTIFRPIIRITLKNGKTSIPLEVLIDSGADICIFSSQIGELLGIDVKKGKAKKVTGVTGESETYYLHPVKLDVGGWEHPALVGFLETRSSDSYGIVGQIGFFDHFSVKFDYKKLEIELKETKNPRLN